MRGLTRNRWSLKSQTRGLQPLGFASMVTVMVLVSLTTTLTRGQNLSATATHSGDAYVAEVLSVMERRANVTARLRSQTRLSDNTLVGTGHFWQLGAGPQRLTRWEMQTQIADKTTSYVQVFDGRYLWTDRHLPSGRQVHRLDVGNLKARLRGNPANSNGSNEWESLILGAEYRGGVSQLIAELLKRFHFDPPRATQLNGFAVEALIGRWRPEQFAELCPSLTEETPWPEQLPQHVLLLVGQSNFFPYIVEFRREADAELAENVSGLKPAQDPLVRYEIFEVRFADAIDATVFQFKPGDVDWSDETTLVYERVTKQVGAAEAELADRRK